MRNLISTICHHVLNCLIKYMQNSVRIVNLYLHGSQLYQLGSCACVYMQYVCNILCLCSYRLHSFTKLLRSAIPPSTTTPTPVRLFHIFTNNQIFSHSATHLHLLNDFSNLHKLRFILCDIKFYGFRQMHFVMYLQLQYHTKQLHCPKKNPLCITYTTLLCPLSTLLWFCLFKNVTHLGSLSIQLSQLACFNQQYAFQIHPCLELDSSFLFTVE